MTTIANIIVKIIKITRVVEEVESFLGHSLEEFWYLQISPIFSGVYASFLTLSLKSIKLKVSIFSPLK